DGGAANSELRGMAHLPRDGTERAKDGAPTAVRRGSLDAAEREPGHQLRRPLSTNNITAFRALRRVAFLRGLYAASGARPGRNGRSHPRLVRSYPRQTGRRNYVAPN